MLVEKARFATKEESRDQWWFIRLRDKSVAKPNERESIDHPVKELKPHVK